MMSRKLPKGPFGSGGLLLCSKREETSRPGGLANKEPHLDDACEWEIPEERREALCGGYNERLFKSGPRKFYHLARFNWVRRQVAACGLKNLRLVEVGCFDGRLINEIGDSVAEYVGLDANWEGGLDLGRNKFAGRNEIKFIKAVDPSPLAAFPNGYFNAAAALETLEHISPDMVGDYLDELARITKGHIFITVPNELGPVFLMKRVAKAILYGHVEPYSWRELAAATLYRSDLVGRNQHKGFDYRELISEVAKRFQIVSVEGLPPLGLPPGLSATAAILASNA
jgi:hypothetical protein